MNFTMQTIRNDNVTLYDDFLAGEWKKEDLKIFNRHVDSSEWKKPIYIVAKNNENNEIAGLIKGDITGGDFYIGHLIVNNSYRGLGIGKKLMIKAIEEAKIDNCHNMTLKTTTKHDVAKFYQKFGFKEIGRISNGAFHLTWIYMSFKLKLIDQNN